MLSLVWPNGFFPCIPMPSQSCNILHYVGLALVFCTKKKLFFEIIIIIIIIGIKKLKFIPKKKARVVAAK